LDNRIEQAITEQIIHNLNYIRENEDQGEFDGKDVVNINKASEYTNKSQLDYTDNPKKSNNLNPPENFRGLFLYKRYQDKEKIKKEHVEHIKEQRNQEEMRGVTFKPKINSHSKKIADETINTTFQVERRLMDKGKQYNNKAINMKTKSRLMENTNTYRPFINEKSVILSEIKKKDRFVHYERALNTSFDNISKLGHKVNITTYDHLDNSFGLKKDVSFNDLGKNPNKSQEKSLDLSSDKYTFSNMRAKSRSKTKDKNNKTTTTINNTFTLHNFLYEEAKLIQEKKEKCK